MRVLILGSEGFIGTHCVDFYLAKQQTVFGVDLFEQARRNGYHYAKISRLSPELDELLSAQQFDAVINAAGSGNVPYSMSHPVLDFEANSLDTIRVLDAIRKHQQKAKYIHLSSAAVYGNPLKQPVVETDRLAPLSPYGWHKLIAEQICQEYCSVFGVRMAIIRPFSVYGPGLKKQMFWDIFQKMKNHPTSVELFGTGNESRDYIYIDDLIQAISFIIDHSPMEGNVYNAASGEETRISDVVRLFFTSLKQNENYFFNGKVRQGDPIAWRADVSRLKDLGFSVKTPISSGVTKLASWLESI